MLQNFKVPGKFMNKKHHITTDVFSGKIWHSDKRATQVGEEINIRWQSSSFYLDEQSNLMLGSHRGWMTLGLLCCKNDSEIFLQFWCIMFLQESRYITSPETWRLPWEEWDVFQSLTCISLNNLEGQKLTVVQLFRGFRGVKLRGSLHGNGCCSSLGLCCCVPGCPQGSSSYKVTLVARDMNFFLSTQAVFQWVLTGSPINKIIFHH